MHQESTHRAQQATAILVLAAIQLVHDADLIAALPLVGEFRRVVQDQDRPVRRGEAVTCRLEMPFEDLGLADPLVGEEAVSRLGVGPVLASQRNALAHGVAHPLQQRPQSLVQTRISEAAAGSLPIEPFAPTLVHRHRSPAIRCQTRNHGRFPPRNNTLHSAGRIQPKCG